MTVPFYFDFISPYAYIAWRRINARSFPEVEPVPVLFAGLLKHHGRLGPAEIPAKRAFIARDCERIAAREGFDLRWPPQHPFNPVTALRLCLPSVSGADRSQVIEALWTACWVDEIPLADPGALSRVLDGLGLEGAALLERTRDPAVKAELRANTDAAIAAGVFGVPSFAVGGEIFWGADRLDDVAEAAANLDS